MESDSSMHDAGIKASIGGKGGIGTAMAGRHSGLLISLHLRLQLGNDEQSNLPCRANPTKPLLFDGASLHPYDALFVKMKERNLQNKDDTTANALRYQDWLNMAVRVQQQNA